VPSSTGALHRLRTSRRLLLKELSAFGTVGAACFLIEIGLFQLLYAVVGAGAVTSKLLATLVSMTVAFFAHRYWSFSHRDQLGMRRQYLVFMVINGVTLVLGLAIVALVRYPLGQEGALVLQVANVGSIVLGSVVRYLSYRRWVFPAQAVPGPAAGPSAAERPTAPARRSPGTSGTEPLTARTVA
jgi:putative flippase GtrA